MYSNIVEADKMCKQPMISHLSHLYEYSLYKKSEYYVHFCILSCFCLHFWDANRSQWERMKLRSQELWHGAGHKAWVYHFGDITLAPHYPDEPAPRQHPD